jgi:HTH-type transcriptional regulator, competence development regulator
MEGPSTLADYLRAAREQAGISQRQLASRIGIHHSYLARLESGETANPAAELLQKIADVLEISAADLFAFIGVKPPQGLPELAPYLRAKYNLDEAAVRELAEHMQRLAQDQKTKTND